jgi:undecaprenyl-diphosphatase
MFIPAITLLLFTFCIFAEAAGGEPIGLDRKVMIALRSRGESSVPAGPRWLQEVARDITSLGSTVVLGIITLTVVTYLFVNHEKDTALLLLIAVGGGLGLNNLLKLLFARPRPEFQNSMRLYTTSFPSGHATMSAITYLTIASLLAPTQSSAMAAMCLVSLAVALTILVGLSRIFLGVHYPTDVVGGWCIGVAWAIACWLTMNWLNGN